MVPGYLTAIILIIRTIIHKCDQMFQCGTVRELTQRLRFELAIQFLTVLSKWGGSEKKKMYRSSAENRLSVLYSVVDGVCNWKKARLGSAVAETTLKPIRSSRLTASQNGVNIRSPDRALHGNCA